MAGLFETPEEVRARIGRTGREQDLSLAGMSGAQMANFGGAQAGRLFAQALGGENPEVARAKKMQRILKESDKKFPDDPYAGLLDAAERFRDEGFVEQSLGALKMAADFDPRRFENRSKKYIRPEEIVLTDEDGVDRTYVVPYDVREGRYLMEQKQLSPKTPTQKGRVKSAEKSAETESAARTEAKIDLPKVKSNARYLKTVIMKAISHPGMRSVVGMPSLGKGLQYIGGTKEAGFRALQQQLEGKTFMQAYETLKGGGQITEIEGQKATDAYQRMKTSSSEEEYVRAANEFISEIDRLTDLAEQRASGKENKLSDDEYEARKKALGL